jgi:HAD superfamily hydrolase (TIGR01549 family)
MSAITGRPPLAVTIDLDDTLYAQSGYLDGAWRAVSAAAGRHGLAAGPLLAALTAVAAQGSDTGRVIDRALERCGVAVTADVMADLVAAFRGYRPDRLSPYRGARAALRRVRDELPVACITDGDPAIQRAKLAALALDQAFDAIVISDEIGRAFRKPHPAPFLAALDALGVPPADAIHIGDRPEKDIAGPHGIGMRAIRVRTGEYAAAPDPSPPADFSFATAADALAAIRSAV